MSLRSEIRNAQSETLETGDRELATDFSISTTNLGKRFNREWIFRNLNITFNAGSTYAITGPNGSGKSTLLQVLWGQIPASLGSISYGNGAIPQEDVYKDVSIATPYMDLIEEFTLREQLEFHFKLRKPTNGMRIEDIMRLMYLEAARDKQIINFSSGMRQRVKLALAFCTEAKAIFLDEPGTNLDKQAFDWYLERLNEITGRKLVLIASNQPSEYPASAVKIDILRYK